MLATCSGAPEADPVGRVLVIGVDGLEWSVLKPLLADGKCPNLRALMERGSFGHLRTHVPTLSPIVWTTIATGRTKEEHGILGFTEGAMQQYTSASRRVPALWNVASRHGLDSDVFGWFITWPAEEIRGLMVSGASATALVDKNWKPTILPDVEGQVWPKDATQDVLAIVRAATSDEAIAKLRARIFPVHEDELGPAEKDLIQQTTWSIAADAGYAAVAREMIAKRPGDLNLVYFGGTDVVAHRFWRYYEPARFRWPGSAESEARWKALAPGAPPLASLFGGEATAKALAQAIPAYYEWIDELVGELVRAAGPEANVMVISDHGFHAQATDAPEDRRLLSGNHQDAPPGVLVAAGPAFAKQDGVDAFVRSDATIDRGDVLAIAPTVLALLGIPSSLEMRERAIASILVGKARANGALTPVKTHDEGFRPATRLATPPEMERSFRERYEGLGYFGDDAPEKR